MSAAAALVSLEHTSCCVCGIVFGVPCDWLAKRRETGTDFYCPNGHTLRYTESEKAKLEKANAALRQRLEWAEKNEKAAREKADTARRAEAIARGKLRAQSERVKNGVCPCCNRSFPNLARHMETKHPGFDGAADA